MRQISLAVIALFLSLVVAFFWLVHFMYDITPSEYIHDSLPLSLAEQDYLNQRQLLLCGSDQAAPPISFSDGVSGEPRGMIVDYMSSLSITLNKQIQTRLFPWNDAVAALDTGKIQMLDLFPSKERETRFAFTQPIYTLRGVVAVRKDAPKLRSPADLFGKQVAVPAGDFAEEYLKQNFSSGQAPVKLTVVPSLPDALALLSSSQADAVAGDETVIRYLLENSRNKDQIAVLDIPLYNKSVCLGVSKNDPILLSVLNKGILDLKKKDILTKIQQNWFGTSSMEIKQNTPYRFGFLLILLVGLLAILFFVWQYLLQKKIEEKTGELNQNRQDLRIILDGQSTYLFVMDEAQRIVECNSALEDLLCQKRSTLLNSPVSHYPLLIQLLSLSGKAAHKLPETPMGSGRPIVESIESGGAATMESIKLDDACTMESIKSNDADTVEFIEPNDADTVEAVPLGSRFFNIRTASLHSSEKRLLISIEDVTKKILRERQFRQESKMIAVGQLSAGLAHEIRNPLGLIKNYMFLLGDYLTDDMSRHAYHVIDSSLERINGLIENLLSVSRADRDRMTDTNVAALIQGLIRLAEEKMRTNGIRCFLDVEWDQPVLLNQEALKVILLNLLDNAVDALKAGDSSLGQKEIHVLLSTEGDRLLIRFSDTGPGMDENQLENLFNAFYTTKEPGKGTGLGLYVVNFEVEKMNGSISVQSKPGQGTSFDILLPLKGQK